MRRSSKTPPKGEKKEPAAKKPAVRKTSETKKVVAKPKTRIIREAVPGYPVNEMWREREIEVDDE